MNHIDRETFEIARAAFASGDLARITSRLEDITQARVERKSAAIRALRRTAP